MWSIEKGKMKLDISKVRSDFKITSENGLHLIHPKKNLWEWEDEEKNLRSLVVDNNGFVVSSGWKKFGNYGEFKNDTDVLNFALANDGVVRFTEKIDGTLLIRSVFDNEVIFRTRGTLYGGEDSDEQAAFGERFKKVAKEKYPILLDPSFMFDRSLLFEYIAPTNLVVIRYKEEDLIFLGFVKHDDLSVGKWLETQKISTDYNLNLVNLHVLPREPLQLINEIKTWKDEGIVARCNDDQIFVKIKSAYYLANHRMKFSMNYLTMVEFIEGGNIQSEDQLVADLKACDYDWEVIESAKEFYHRYENAVELKNRLMQAAQNFFNNFENEWNSKVVLPAKKNWQFKMENQRLRKKEFALSLNKTNFDNLPSNFIRPLSFCIYDNKQERLHELCRKIILTEGKK